MIEHGRQFGLVEISHFISIVILRHHLGSRTPNSPPVSYIQFARGSMAPSAKTLSTKARKQLHNICLQSRASEEFGASVEQALHALETLSNDYPEDALKLLEVRRVYGV